MAPFQLPKDGIFNPITADSHKLFIVTMILFTNNKQMRKAYFLYSNKAQTGSQKY